MGRTIIVDGVGTDTGTLELPGSVRIGNDPTEDTVIVTALVASDIVPDGVTPRTLGSGANKWGAIEVEDLRLADTDMFSGTFTFTSSLTTSEQIVVVTYIAADYVGGEMTVWMSDGTVANYGVAKYVFSNHDNGVSQAADMDKIGGAQSSRGINPIDAATTAFIDAASPKKVELVIATTAGFPNPTTFEGKFHITLFKA
jgi:hypothetical protein